MKAFIVGITVLTACLTAQAAEQSFTCGFFVGSEEIFRDTISANSPEQAIFHATLKNIELDGRGLPTIKGYAMKTSPYAPTISNIVCK